MTQGGYSRRQDEREPRASTGTTTSPDRRQRMASLLVFLSPLCVVGPFIVVAVRMLADPPKRVYCDGLNACQPDLSQYLPTTVGGWLLAGIAPAVGALLFAALAALDRSTRSHAAHDIDETTR